MRNKNDIDLLFDYGIRAVIDLKMIDETSSPIKNDKRFIGVFQIYLNLLDRVRQEVK